MNRPYEKTFAKVVSELVQDAQKRQTELTKQKLSKIIIDKKLSV
jgi:hypothetical protein